MEQRPSAQRSKTQPIQRHLANHRGPKTRQSWQPQLLSTSVHNSLLAFCVMDSAREFSPVENLAQRTLKCFRFRQSEPSLFFVHFLQMASQLSGNFLLLRCRQADAVDFFTHEPPPVTHAKPPQVGQEPGKTTAIRVLGARAVCGLLASARSAGGRVRWCWPANSPLANRAFPAHKAWDKAMRD